MKNYRYLLFEYVNKIRVRNNTNDTANNKGSNDSTSAPSSAGDISYEDSDKSRKLLIKKQNNTNSNQQQQNNKPQSGLNSLFGDRPTATTNNSNNIINKNAQTTANISTSGDIKNSTQSKQQQQQRMQDAIHELELCRVINRFLEKTCLK